MKPRFEIWKSAKNKQWYWLLRAGNGRIVCQSEGYKRRADAESTMIKLDDIAYSAWEWFNDDIRPNIKEVEE